ncbi:uncharacterized protein LOC143692114 [Agelaius phoeniceus]|uniref:uncharacterized protein LOC143692114 n=1 Tax=Agelaius phoeniceus TaxID=39638 RepID=UPI00405520D9
MAGGWNWVIFMVPSKPNHFMNGKSRPPPPTPAPDELRDRSGQASASSRDAARRHGQPGTEGSAALTGRPARRFQLLPFKPGDKFSHSNGREQACSHMPGSFKMGALPPVVTSGTDCVNFRVPLSSQSFSHLLNHHGKWT